jgi:ATP-dependent Lon protease
MSGHPCCRRPITLPLLPLRDVVVFPHMVIPLFVGRPKSIKALEAAMESGRQIMLVAQKAAGKDEPKADDMFDVGCVSSILQMLKLPDGTVKVLVEGVQRANTSSITETRRLLRRRSRAGAAGQRGVARDRSAAPRRDAAVRPVRQAQQEDPARDPDQHRRHRRRRPSGRHHRRAPAAQARGQAVGAGPVRVAKRLEKLLELLEHEVDILQVEKRIRGRVKRQMEKSQREYYLNEQVKAIQKELGDGEEGADLEELEKKIKAAA